MVKLIVFSLVFFIGVTDIIGSCDVNKVIYNYVFSKQVIGLTNQMRLYDKTYLNMDKDIFDIDQAIMAKGVKLYDLTRLVSRDTYTWTKPGNTSEADVNFGLDKMVLIINLLKYNGKEYQNTNVTVSDVTLHTIQSTTFKSDSCDQRYLDTKVLPISKAVLDDGTDVTDDFNKEVIPWINKQMASDDFDNLILKYFNNCDPASNVRLLDLIVAPYSK